MTQNSKQISRRDALKILAAAAGASVLANLPSRWTTPKLVAGVLPAHAQTSAGLPLVLTVSVVSLISSPIGFTVSQVRPPGNGGPLLNWELRGKVTDDGGQPISANGFVYSSLNTSPELGAANTTGVLGNPNPAGVGNEFSVQVYLPPVVPHYYIRAYATNSAGTGYGSVVQTGSISS